MVGKLLRKIFGTKNGRELKRLGKVVAKVNKFEPDYQALSDDALKAVTAGFKQRLTDGDTSQSLLKRGFLWYRQPLPHQVPSQYCWQRTWIAHQR